MMADEARRGDWGQDVLDIDYHTEGFSCYGERDPLRFKAGSSVITKPLF